MPGSLMHSVWQSQVSLWRYESNQTFRVIVRCRDGPVLCWLLVTLAESAVVGIKCCGAETHPAAGLPAVAAVMT